MNADTERRGFADEWEDHLRVHLEPILVSAALLFVFLFGTGLNTLVFFLFYRRPSLRSVSNRFVLSLTTANVLSTVLVVNSHALKLISRDDHHLEANDEAACPVWCRLDRFMTTLSVQSGILSVLVIAIDRYCAVTSPLHYAVTVTRQRSIKLISAVWAASIMVSAPQLFLHFGSSSTSIPVCTSGQTLMPIKQRRLIAFYYATVLAALGFTLPLIVLCGIYLKMYQIAHSNSQRTRRHSISTAPLDVSLPESPPAPTPNNSIRLSWKRSSNQNNFSLFFKEEGKAIKTSIFIIGSYIISWMSFYCYNIVQSSICHHPYLEDAATLLALSSTCSTPFIYVYRNDTARSEALKIICRKGNNSLSSPSSSRGNSFQSKLGSRQTSPDPLLNVKSDGAPIFSYSTECQSCGSNKMVTAVRDRSIPSAKVMESNNLAGKQSEVSITLNPLSKTCVNCRQFCRTTPPSAEYPVIVDRWRYPRHAAVMSTRFAKPRLSSGSVHSRRNSSVSTNSSVVSCTLFKGSARRYSAASFSGDTTFYDKFSSTTTFSDVTFRRHSCQQSVYSDDQVSVTKFTKLVDSNEYGISFPSHQIALNLSPKRSYRGRSASVDKHRSVFEEENLLMSDNAEKNEFCMSCKIMPNYISETCPTPLTGFRHLAIPENFSVYESPMLKRKSCPNAIVFNTKRPKSSGFLPLPPIDFTAKRRVSDVQSSKSDSDLNGCKIDVIKGAHSAD